MGSDNEIKKINFMDPKTQSCPYKAYEKLRDECPIYFMPDLGFYMITKYEDGRKVLLDTETFSNKPTQHDGFEDEGIKAHAEIMSEFGVGAFVETLQRTDPPIHTKYRKLLNKAFTASRVKELKPSISKIINDLIDGFIKLKFDKRDKILPRSIISFYTSKDGENWDMVGYERTSGSIINLNKNSAYIEIGGHSDGQSFGNTFLDSTIKEVNIISNNKSKNVIFTKNNLNKDYFVFKPNQINNYNANISFENNGIKLFRPNKYWLAIENNLDFSNDFEIVLHLTFPEIPQQRQTLISNTSIFNGQVQSWKLETDDGRLFFSWADSEGVFLDANNIGDKSLRSGVLIQQNGQLSNTSPPIVDPSFLSQLTTAHNGYLTFSVEFGLMFSILFYMIIAFGMFKVLSLINSSNIFPYLAMMMFLIQNITNDMIYSPDMFVLFIVSTGIFIQSTKSFEDKKS